MKPTLKYTFCRSRKVKAPEYGTAGSAGIDFFIPENLVGYDVKFSPSTGDTTGCLCSCNAAGYVSAIAIPPKCGALIPSGIKVRIPKGYAIVFVNKSGVATKKGLNIGACCIDEDYTGEIHLHIFNTSRTDVVVKAGEKIAQGLLLPVAHCNLKFVETEKKLFAGLNTERQDGGFGSTGTNVK